MTMTKHANVMSEANPQLKREWRVGQDEQAVFLVWVVEEERQNSSTGVSAIQTESPVLLAPKLASSVPEQAKTADI